MNQIDQLPNQLPQRVYWYLWRDQINRVNQEYRRDLINDTGEYQFYRIIVSNPPLKQSYFLFNFRLDPRDIDHQIPIADRVGDYQTLANHHTNYYNREICNIRTPIIYNYQASLPPLPHRYYYSKGYPNVSKRI